MGSRYFQIQECGHIIIPLSSKFVEDQENKGTLWLWCSDEVWILDTERDRRSYLKSKGVYPLPETFCWVRLPKRCGVMMQSNLSHNEAIKILADTLRRYVSRFPRGILTADEYQRCLIRGSFKNNDNKSNANIFILQLGIYEVGYPNSDKNGYHLLHTSLKYFDNVMDLRLMLFDIDLYSGGECTYRIVRPLIRIDPLG